MCSEQDSDMRPGHEFVKCLAAASVLAFCLSAVGCASSEGISDVSIDAISGMGDRYDGKIVRLDACVVATRHVVGLTQCTGDAQVLLELRFTGDARGKQDRKKIMTEVVRAHYATGPILPMRATGRYHHRAGVGILELHRADFE